MTTFVLILSLIFETVSGIVLYIVPSGRVARWTGWTLWGLSKGEWQALHIIFALVLLLIIVAHLYFNWRVVAHFFWSKVKGAVNLKAELAVASLITLFIFMGTLWNLPPFSNIIDFGREARHSWETHNSTGFGQGKGRWAVSSLIDKEHNTVNRRGKAITLRHPADSMDYGVRPQGRGNASRYESLAYSRNEIVGERERGRGFGRKTVEMICVENGISLEEGLFRLSEKGIHSHAGERLRDCAKRSGSRPNDVVHILMGGTGVSAVKSHARSVPPLEKGAGHEDRAPGKLRGRDLVHLGKLTSLSGTLKKDGDEWVLMVNGTAYDLHMGPNSYRESKGFVMTGGNFATVRGFLYGKDMAATSVDTLGQVIVLRDDTGRPSWTRM